MGASVKLLLKFVTPDILAGVFSMDFIRFPSPQDVDADHFPDVLPIFAFGKLVSIESGDIGSGSLVPTILRHDLHLNHDVVTIIDFTHKIHGAIILDIGEIFSHIIKVPEHFAKENRGIFIFEEGRLRLIHDTEQNSGRRFETVDGTHRILSMNEVSQVLQMLNGVHVVIEMG